MQWEEGWDAGGREGEGVSGGMYMFSLTGAEVPITSYTCTQPSYNTFTDDQCTVNVSRQLRMCAIKEGARPHLLSSSRTVGLYGWNSNINPFVVLDIPQGWCVESVKMTFENLDSIPTLSLSVHSAERLSTNTDRTTFSLVSEEGTTPVVMNLTTLARGKYLRINMTSTGPLYLREIEVFGTSRYTFTDTRNLHDMLTPLLTSLNLSSVTDDSICTHPSSAGGDSASPTTSVTAIRKYSTQVHNHVYCEYSSWYSSLRQPPVNLTMRSLVTSIGGRCVELSTVLLCFIVCPSKLSCVTLSTFLLQ